MQGWEVYYTYTDGSTVEPYSVTNKQNKFSLINGVAVLQGVFYKTMYGLFCHAANKKWL